METPEVMASNFIVDDLLDFPNDDTVVEPETELAAAAGTGNSTDNSCNSTAELHFNQTTEIGGTCNFADGQFSGELTVPEDDLAELEWVSKFVDESFSNEDLQKLQLIQGTKEWETTTTPQYQFQPQTPQPGPNFQPELSVPGKARSKRSRTAPDNWTSRLLAVSPIVPPFSSDTEKKTNAKQTTVSKKREGPDNSTGGEARRCLHCATDNTPQWRTGPMGPKTLCNACGVRYKSGRLVPEYRPAASPTFVLSKHSNSHRKVLELRRQKEMQQQQQFLHHHHHHQNMMFDVSSGDEYLIHQHIGPGPIFGS